MGKEKCYIGTKKILFYLIKNNLIFLIIFYKNIVIIKKINIINKLLCSKILLYYLNNKIIFIKKVMEINMKENGFMVKEMDWGHINGKMEDIIMECGNLIILMGKESTFLNKAKF